MRSVTLSVILALLSSGCVALEIDGRSVSKQCGWVPAQPVINLPIQPEAFNKISDHNAKVMAWLECARRAARSQNDWDLIETVEHGHRIWVEDGIERLKRKGAIREAALVTY